VYLLVIGTKLLGLCPCLHLRLIPLLLGVVFGFESGCLPLTSLVGPPPPL
jgi:hypothetical protein